MCQNLQERFERDPEFLLKIITCDETWVLGYKVETNQQFFSGRAHHLRAQKVKISLLKYEEHAYYFFQHYYIDTCLWENVQQKQPEMWNSTMSVHECAKYVNFY